MGMKSESVKNTYDLPSKMQCIWTL